MIQATDKERAIVVELITETFLENPSVNIVIGEGGNRKKKISRLADYAFTKSLNRKGAFISQNQKGVALCFRSDEGGSNLKELYYEVRFALAIPVKNVIATLKREGYIKKHRLSEPHLYFWFLGVNKDGEKAVFELKEHFFELSSEQNLPILLETSVMRNRLIYERYGFEVYHTWEDSGNGKALWFMMRKPS